MWLCAVQELTKFIKEHATKPFELSKEVEEEDTKAGVADEALGEKRAERRWTWGREKGYLMRE